MNQEDLELMLNPATFAPFVITVIDGFALPINNPRDTLLTDRTLVVKHNNLIYQIPFRAIARTSEKGENL